MAVHKLLNNFTGGELSPELDARVDLQKYDTGCRTLINYRPLPWGGALFRSGTQYIAPVKDSTKETRLIPFKFSTDVTYVLELGDLYIRFYTDGEQVLSGPSTPYEIVSPFTEDELFAIQYKEINDVVYMVHPDHHPQKLTRIAATNWTIADVDWTYPALLDENDSATTLMVSATTGSGRTMTASTSIFDASHVGSFWEIRHLRASNKVELDLSGAVPTTNTQSSNLKVKGEWALVTSERWYGVLNLQRSTDAGATWETFRTFTARSDRNVNASGNQETEALFRLDYTVTGDPYGIGAWTGTAPTNFVKARAALEVAEVYSNGLVEVTGYTSGLIVTVTVISALEATTATKVWSEGAWSDYRGYPRTIGLYEQRILYAGTYHQPNTIWGSVTADFDNFAFSEFDDAAFAYQIAATEQNPIQWLAPLASINVGTSGGEFYIRSGNGEEPLTPSNVAVRGGTNYGSEHMRALCVDSAMIYLQRQGKRIRELKERSPYVNTTEDASADLTLLAEHITETGIVQMDFARLPDGQVYAVRGDGKIAVMTYNREQNITAWSRYATLGSFESVACVYGSPADVVYVIVRRFIDGAFVRYVEVFTANVADKRLGVFMDSSVTYSGSPATVITGLDHLEGSAVSVVADGYVVSNGADGASAELTVSGGQITLPTAASVVNVGLHYIGELRPMKIDSMMSNGTSQGRKRRISELVVRFKDTLGGIVGTGSSQDLTTPQFAETIVYRDTTDPMDASPPLFTGDIPFTWQGNSDFSADIKITQRDPFPMNVQGIFAKFEVFGE
jgi:hypothetical protein